MTRISGIFTLGALALLALFAAGCSKKDDGKTGSAADSALVLPDQPPLPPVEDEFQEPDSASEGSSRPQNPEYGQVPQGAYVLQIRLFSNKAAAVRYAENLKNSGIPAYVSEVVNPKPDLPGTYYRVRAGSFATTAAAREYARLNLEPLGVTDAWADLKARDSEPVNPVYSPRPQAAPAPVAKPVPPPAPVPVTPPAPPAPAPVPQPVAPKVEPAPAPVPPPAPQPKPDTPAVEDW